MLFSAAYADAGVEPIDFPMAPTVALPHALKRANLTVDDIARFEINEAFSVVVRIAEKLLQIDPAKVNVDGYDLRLCLDMTLANVLIKQWRCRTWPCDWKLRRAHSGVPHSRPEIWGVWCSRHLQRSKWRLAHTRYYVAYTVPF